MDKVWEFFENMNEIVYVADMDTHEMIYLNQAGLKAYGLKDNSQVEGRKCYELLQNSAAPCAICTNKKLREGYFMEWYYYNAIIKCGLKLKDTMIMDGGRRLRIEIAVRENEGEQRKQKLVDRQKDLEKISKEAFSAALRVSSPMQSLDVLLEYLGKALSAERIYIFEKNEKGNDDNTFEWVASGVTAEIDNLQDLPTSVCAGWYEAFEKQDMVIIKDLEDIRESDPLMYDTLKPQKIHSLVVGPLYDAEKVIGFYGVDNPPAEFLDYCSDMLQIAGNFTSALLKMRNLLKQLNHMSHYDQLTGLGNRYSMIEATSDLPENQRIGVIFGDITGLKRVNDSQGHEAGDALVRRAADCLVEVFGLDRVFRIGGDEMVVLCRGFEEQEDVEARIRVLRERLKERDVNLALGMAWHENGAVNVDELLREAEQSMYKDKSEFYRMSGIDRRDRRLGDHWNS